MTAKAADAVEERPESPEQVWDIPLFPFSEHTLAEGTMPSAKGRVLIDSGNFAQTLMWPVWERTTFPAIKARRKVCLSSPRAIRTTNSWA